MRRRRAKHKATTIYAVINKNLERNWFAAALSGLFFLLNLGLAVSLNISYNRLF
jgi:hypothetical protein